MGYSVGQVAGFAHVTVRTLHHYDEIGLLTPSDRTAAGYRRYSNADLERLEQILFYRKLGFTLERIAAVLDDPDADASVHLRRQHALLVERIGGLQDMAAAIERAMEAREMGTPVTPQELFEIFGEWLPEGLVDEVEQRWGDTDAYQQARHLASSAHTKEEWLQMKAESTELEQRMADARRAGTPADSEAAMDLAEAHRQLFIRWFHDCDHEMQRAVADLYFDSPLFRGY